MACYNCGVPTNDDNEDEEFVVITKPAEPNTNPNGCWDQKKVDGCQTCALAGRIENARRLLADNLGEDAMLELLEAYGYKAVAA